MPHGELLELTGHLGRDPKEITRKDSGEYCGVELSIPVDHRRKNRDTGEWETEGTNWWRVTVWGDAGKPILTTLRKGDPVRARCSKIGVRVYQGQDGEPKTQLEAVAFNGDVSRVLWQKRDKGQGGSKGPGQGDPAMGPGGLDFSDLPEDFPRGDVGIPF